MAYRQAPIISIFSLVLLCSAIVSALHQKPNPPYDVIFGWKQIDFLFKTPAHREESLESGAFIPKNNVITGIKVSGNRVFLTVPRWRSGVPATLNYVSYDRSMGTQPNKEPLLNPYPSWEHNQQGNCSVIQYVQSMEIDQFNRMWVVDVGRRNLFEGTPDNKCVPKIVLIDLNTDKIIRSYEFPADVVSRNSSFLNDIVVGCTSETDCIAYISDATDAKIIVYDLRNDKSWFVEHPSMRADPNAVLITIQGKNYTFDTAVDGIALSNRDSNFGTVYYSPLSSYNVYSIPAVTAKQAGTKNQAGVRLEDADVTLVGRKPSQTDGMTIDANGILYYGLLGTSGINSWNTSKASLTAENQVVVAQNDEDLQWPDTFAIDEEGYLYATPNRLHRYNTNSLNFTDVNFRVVRFFIHTKSYMFPKGDVPTTS